MCMRSGEQGEAEIGRAPRKTAVLEAVNILQWALYYPAVLDPAELRLSTADEARVAGSLTAYRAGDLLGALERYPVNINAHGRDRFTTGAAQALAEAVVRDHGKVIDTQEWTRNVTISVGNFIKFDEQDDDD